MNSWFNHIAGNNHYGVQVSLVLRQAVILSTTYLSLRTAATRDLDSLRLTSGCRGKKTERVAQNVWRMLAGKRPLYQADSVKSSSFLREFILPIDKYHYYPGVGYSLTGGAARRVFMSDVEQMKDEGMTILECHYDENPDDGHHEEQYYWGPSLGAQVFSPIPFIWLTFLESSQQRMDKAAGVSGRFIHPFTTYGAPRRECPSERDPGLDMARVEDPELIEWPKGKCKPVGNRLFDCP